MRMPPLLADLIHARGCKLKCEKFLTLPTRSFWGLSSPKIEMGGKALKWLSRLDYPLAKTGETVNGGAESAVHLDR